MQLPCCISKIITKNWLIIIIETNQTNQDTTVITIILNEVFGFYTLPIFTLPTSFNIHHSAARLLYIGTWLLGLRKYSHIYIYIYIISNFDVRNLYTYIPYVVNKCFKFWIISVCYQLLLLTPHRIKVKPNGFFMVNNLQHKLHGIK